MQISADGHTIWMMWSFMHDNFICSKQLKYMQKLIDNAWHCGQSDTCSKATAVLSTTVDWASEQALAGVEASMTKTAVAAKDDTITALSGCSQQKLCCISNKLSSARRSTLLALTWHMFATQAAEHSRIIQICSRAIQNKKDFSYSALQPVVSALCRTSTCTVSPGVKHCSECWVTVAQSRYSSVRGKGSHWFNLIQSPVEMAFVHALH